MSLKTIKAFLGLGNKPVNPYSTDAAVFENRGFCTTCQQEVRFAATNKWYRDFYLCTSCGSVPRERALMWVIDEYYPDWKHLVIHESSPIGRGASCRLQSECGNYIPSQYFSDKEPGSEVEGIRCEDLEALTFGDESIDLHVSQDVAEHIFSPAAAFREIARTLKPGGAHIFTTPIVNKHKASQLRAQLNETGEIEFLQPPEYHGNPIDDKGSLVTIDWGYDICRHIFDASGLFTHIIRIDDIDKGIRAEYIEVLVTIKTDPDSVLDKIP